MIIRPLPHYNERPPGTTIDTLIVHSMSPGDSCSAEESCKLLEKHEVSAHYLITQEGELWQCVSEDLRAWHAGQSMMPFDYDNRPVVNDFSIGVELITPTAQTYTDAQYLALENLIDSIATRHPLKYILGHDHIAPGRKQDPGPNFNWSKIKKTPYIFFESRI